VLVSSYPVKVADSCPLSFDQKQDKMRGGRGNAPMSEMEIEALRLQKMKKQAFLDKISKELKEKEK
jgi:hypothetical protein